MAVSLGHEEEYQAAGMEVSRYNATSESRNKRRGKPGV